LIHAAIEAIYIHHYTDIISDAAYDIVPNIYYIDYNNLISDILSDIVSDIVSDIESDISQAGLVPPLDKEATA
jgi:hypothetical protein